MRALNRIVMFALASFVVLAMADSPPARAVGGPGLGCATHVNSLTKSGSYITAVGSQNCDFIFAGPLWRELIVRVQRSRWYGWETMATSGSGWRTPSFYSEQSATHNCYNTGTHTFQGVSQGLSFPGIGSVFAATTEHRWGC